MSNRVKYIWYSGNQYPGSEIMKPSRQKETLKENINFKRKHFYIEIEIEISMGKRDVISKRLRYWDKRDIDNIIRLHIRFALLSSELWNSASVDVKETMSLGKSYFLVGRKLRRIIGLWNWTSQTWNKLCDIKCKFEQKCLFLHLCLM